jgi:tetratricopeptide (TPR) repeat protein
MNCAQCSNETNNPGWFVSRVDRHIVLKKRGDSLFKYDLDLYSFRNLAGHLLFSARGGRRIIKPDTVALYGDANCYWVTPVSADKQFCSRRCSVLYAALHNCVLIRRSDGIQITPQQEMFDEYAREHQLEHALAIIRADESTSPEQEFVGLLSAHLQFPNRLVALAFALIGEGKTSLAERAITKLRSDFPSGVALQYCAAIFSRLGKYKDVNVVYEELASALGGKHRIDPQVKSTWAWCTASCDPESAIRLSKEAVEAAPGDNTIIENHLAILCDHQPEAAVQFFREHQFEVKDDVGFLAAGKAFLRTECFSEAEEHLRLAVLIDPDPRTKAYLAETLLRMNRPGEALLLCRDLAASIELYEEDSPKDFDGEIRNPVRVPYKLKKHLKRALLAIEGKCLIELGETESGQERIRDAIDIRQDIGPQDVFFEEIESLVNGYQTRSDVEFLLAAEQRRAMDLFAEKEKAAKVITRLSDLISAVADTQEDWRDALLNIKAEAESDTVANHFANKIHSFCMRIRSNEVGRYKSIWNSIQQEFSKLPSRAVEQIANAEFLLSSHKEEMLPIYAGAIIEYSKAVETAINEIIILPYVASTFQKDSRAAIEVPSTRQPAKFVEVKFRGKPKALTLGELCLVLQSPDTGWKEFCTANFARRCEWIRAELPTILRRIKDDFRNGCAHSSSGSRQTALALKKYLTSSEVLASLEAIANSAQGCATNA